jgi:hypothetical protein
MILLVDGVAKITKMLDSGNRDYCDSSRMIK